MSLAGFKATNHPQQTAKRAAVDAVDDRGTDQAFFDSLSERFDFNLDVAAAAHNAKCRHYFTLSTNALVRDWMLPNGETGRVWCNPPYSNIGEWVAKAQQQWSDGLVDFVVMLLPANRVEQRWWQEMVEPYRDGKNGHRFLTVEFLPGRMRFTRPDWQPGPKGDRPPFGCCLLIWGAA